MTAVQRKALSGSAERPPGEAYRGYSGAVVPLVVECSNCGVGVRIFHPYGCQGGAGESVEREMTPVLRPGSRLPWLRAKGLSLRALPGHTRSADRMPGGSGRRDATPGSARVPRTGDCLRRVLLDDGDINLRAGQPGALTSGVK